MRCVTIKHNATLKITQQWNNQFFNLFDAINREGIDNSTWGLCQDIADTQDYFGTKESFALQGQFVYVYVNPDSLMPFMDRTGIKPTYTLSFEDDNTTINIYQL